MNFFNIIIKQKMMIQMCKICKVFSINFTVCHVCRAHGKGLTTSSFLGGNFLVCRVSFADVWLPCVLCRVRPTAKGLPWAFGALSCAPDTRQGGRSPVVREGTASWRTGWEENKGYFENTRGLYAKFWIAVFTKPPSLDRDR